MTGPSRLASLWRNLFHRAHVEQDLDDELHAYVDLLTEEKVRSGMSLAEARRAARIEAGGVEHIKEDVRDVRIGFLLETAIRDLRYAVRSLRRTPAFTIAVISCFALGIGVNTVMFSVVDTLFLRAPMGVSDPGRVGRLYSTAVLTGRPPHTRSRFTTTEYSAFRDALAPIASLGAYWSADVAVGRGADAEHVAGAVATASLLPLLGAQPALGRYFDSAEDNPGAAPEAVISYGYWTRHFLRQRTAIGQSLQVGGLVYTIVGVAQREFGGIDLDPVDIWLPLGPAAPDLIEPDFFSGMNTWLSVVARLRPAATPQGVEQAMKLVLQRRHPDISFQSSFGPLQGARGPMRSPEAALVLWVAVVSIVVLLIACANVAALQVGRAVSRRREYAIRLALGAGRARLVSQLVVETALLSLAGTGLALAVATNVAATVQGLLLPGNGAQAMLAPGRMIIFSAITAMVAGAASGILPALQSTRTDQRAALTEPRGRASLRYGPRRSVLVGQVALTFSLLIMAGLFVRSVTNARSIDLGFDPSRLLIVSLDRQGTSKYQGPARLPLYQQMLERVRRMPAVQHASLSQGSPLESALSAAAYLPGHPLPRGSSHQFVYPVSPDFLATMGIRLLRGRGFLESDRSGTQPVAVVNEALVRELWPGEDPVGQCFRFGDAPCTTVVGVVANTSAFRITDQPQELFFQPFEQGVVAGMPVTLEIRTTASATEAIGPLRRELAAADPDMPFISIQTVSDRIASQMRPWTLGSTMFTAYGLLALLLSALGLYGLLTYTVVQRTREVGIRVALGADAHRVLRMVMGDGVRLTLVGVLIGAACGLGLGRALASLLYGVSAFDGIAVGAGAATLLLVALVASYLPGRRAAGIDPNVALRAE